MYVCNCWKCDFWHILFLLSSMTTYLGWIRAKGKWSTWVMATSELPLSYALRRGGKLILMFGHYYIVGRGCIVNLRTTNGNDENIVRVLLLHLKTMWLLHTCMCANNLWRAIGVATKSRICFMSWWKWWALCVAKSANCVPFPLLALPIWTIAWTTRCCREHRL